MARLRLRLLGGFALQTPSRALPLPAKKAQALIAYLALRPGRPHARETLTALLWGDVGEKQARQSLRQTLFRVRKVFAAARNPGFVVRGGTVTVNPSSLEVDVAAFERLIGKKTADALVAAAALYEGAFLEGLCVDEAPFEQWLRSERERLRELALEGMTKLLGVQTKSGATEAAIQTAVRLLAFDPLHESTHRTLMRLYVAHGRRATALRQYQTCVTVLQRELNVEPEAETKRLYQGILQRQASPAPSTPTLLPGHARAAARALAARASSKETPLVGRDVEGRRWRQRLREAWRGQGAVLFVTGEAGIGKSRFVEELLEEGAHRGARVVTGKAYETEQSLPFRPWIDALRAAGAVAALDATANRYPQWRAELARLFPELAVGGLRPAITPESHQRLFETIDQLLVELARGHPLLVALEDMHWADEMSLRLLSFVAHRLASRPIVLIATARDEELTDAPILRRMLDELSAALHVEHLPLGPLSRDATTALVRALARAGSNDTKVLGLAEKVWAISEGNPFVIVETMRTIHHEPPDAPTVELPHRVRGMIAARLDRLSQPGQRLAAVAAVIEREFSFALLQRAAGLSRRDTAEGVEELVRRRVLDAVGERFDFTHVRIRNAIYETLLAPRRIALHAAVGEALEAVSGHYLDEISDRLAYHFSRADEPARALDHLIRLADRVARSHALEEAVRVLQDARRYVDRLPPEERDRRHLDLVYRLAPALLLLGRSAEARDVLGKEEARIDRLRDPSLSGPYYFWLSHTAANLGDSEQAAQAAQRALEDAARCNDAATMGKASYQLARESYMLGRPLEGVAHGRQAIALLEGTDERWWLGQAHWGLALNLLHIGDFGPALEVLERMHAIGEALGDTRLQSQAASFMGRIHSLIGEHEKGIALLKRALEVAADPVSRAAAFHVFAVAFWEKDDPDQAIPAIEEALAQAQHLSGFGGYRYRQFDAWLTCGLSEMYARKGDLPRALDLAQKAVDVATRSKWPVAVAYAQRAMGRVASAQGDFSGAAAWLERAVETFAAHETRFQVARTQLLLGEVQHAGGDHASGRRNVREAYHTFQRLRVPHWTERAQRVAAVLKMTLTS